MYRVDMEKQETDGATGNLTGYSFDPHPDGLTDEESARKLVDTLKIMGVGGRLVHMDGTPDGMVVESWAGIGRVCDATAIEQQARTEAEKGGG